MRALFTSLFINLIIPASAHLESDPAIEKIHALYQNHYANYKNYLKMFNKKQDMSVIEPIRLLHYAKSVKQIEEHNKRYEKGLESYKLGLNEMSDWTNEEYERAQGHRPSAEPDKNSTNKIHKMLQKIIRKKLPKSIDYRKKGILSPIKMQGRCGVCYIFSAVAALEAYTAKKKHQPPVPLSEQNIMDCSGLERCDGMGGSGETVWNYVAKTEGIMSAADYPYETRDGQCRYRASAAKVKCKGSAMLPEGDETAIKYALAYFGPVSVSLHANLDSFKQYRQGVYFDNSCPRDLEYVTHEVLAVGYGTDENGLDYLIIRNSWGTTWGEAGYGRIAANRHMCSIGHQNWIPLF